MSVLVCFTMDNLSDAADLWRGVIDRPRRAGSRPALEVGFPAMLDLFEARGVTITHFVEGWNGEAHPETVQELVSRGHEVGMHGWQHENWSALADDKAYELAEQATRTLEKAAGVRPEAFRAPGGRRSPYTARILSDLGYRIDASLDPTGVDGGPVTRLAFDLWTVPYQWIAVDATHWLWKNLSCEDVGRIWRHALEAAAERGRPMTFIWHPHIMGVDPERRRTGADILDFVNNDERFRPATLGELVAQYRPSGS